MKTYDDGVADAQDAQDDEAKRYQAKKAHAQHTPGPWALQMNDDLVIIGPPETDGDYRFVATTDSKFDTGRTPNKTDKANAVLVAAAPELLEAVKAVNPMDVTTKARELIAKAIAKAEGRS